MVFPEEEEALQVHGTLPRHLKGNAGKRDVCRMVRGDVIGGDLGPNRKDIQRAEVFGGTLGCCDRQ